MTSSEQKKMRRIAVTTCVAVSLLAPSLLTAQRTLIIGTVEASPGGSTSVPVTFSNDGTIVGLQFDVSYDPTVLTLTSVATGAALVDHVIDSQIVSTGQLRVLAHSATNAVLGNGTLLSLGFDVDAAASGFTPIDRSMVVLGDQVAVSRVPNLLQSGGVDVVPTGCGSPDVDQLQNLSVAGVETFEACITLTAGPNFTVEGTGQVTLRAGREVILVNDVDVLEGGTLTIQLDPGLLPP